MLQDQFPDAAIKIQKPALDTSLVLPEEIERIRQTVADYQTGHVEEALFRRFRLQHGIYGVRNEIGIQMVRVRVPYGRLTARQLETMSHVAEFYASGHGHITTRQDLQFYRIPLEQVPEMLAELGRAGLTTREASGNVVRNVTADPLAGVAPDEAFDVRPYADATGRFLLRNPICQNMGRKFKIAFSGSPADRAFAPIHDVGAIARIVTVGDRPVYGFDIFVGGGLGANPRLAHRLEPFTPAKVLLPTIEAIIRIFDRLGNRKNRNKARLKFLIEQMGIEAFRELVFQERAILPMVNSCRYPEFSSEHVGRTSEPPPVVGLSTKGSGLGTSSDPDYRYWLEMNIVQQKQAGYTAAYVRAPTGDLTGFQFHKLAGISRRYAGGELFTTTTQNIVLRWVPKSALPDLYRALRDISLAEAGVHRLTDVVGCPGADTCNMAITTSHRLAHELNRRFGQQPEVYLAPDLQGIDIKISGCPNSCGHHHIAAIGFYGRTRRINGLQVPCYQMLLGGRVQNGSVVLGTPVTTIPARNVPEAVERVVALYRAGRRSGETFLNWIDRVGATSLREAFNDYQTLPDPTEAPEAYRDWGQETAFTLQVGEGECAA